MSEVERHHGLQRPFPELPLMASTVNFGPRVVTRRHKDFKNLSFGLCAIVILGNFNHKTGGKLRFEEVGVELEVAPGDIVYAPSASITHYNTPIGPDETRSSITFYTSGQMFRWVQDGFRSVKSLTRVQRRKAMANGRNIWQGGWGLYLRADEILD